MADYERDYGVARFVFGFVELVGWLSFCGGLLLALVAFNGAQSSGYMYGGANGTLALFATLPGLGIAIAGFFAVAQAQSGRAHVDTAEMTRELLVLARKQAMLPTEQATPTPVHTESPFSRTPEPVDPDEVSWKDDPDCPRFGDDEVASGTYRGFDIVLRWDGYIVGDQLFATKGKLKGAIDDAYRRRAQAEGN